MANPRADHPANGLFGVTLRGARPSALPLPYSVRRGACQPVRFKQICARARDHHHSFLLPDLHCWLGLPLPVVGS